MSGCGGSVSAASWAAVCVVLVLAGCLGSTPAPPAPDGGDHRTLVPGGPYDRITTNLIPDGPGHDHTDPAQHELARNIGLLDADGPGDITNPFGELDVVGDRAYQCVLGDGFRIFDITNRSDPLPIGRYGGIGCADIKVTDDNALAVVGGARLFDVTDPAAPVEIATYGRGCHMCFIHVIGGVEYVFMTQSLRGQAPDDLPGQGYVEIVRIVRGDPLEASRLEPVAEYKMDPTTAPNTHLWDVPRYEFSIHDMYVYDDPLLDRPVMLVAHWDMGVRFVDVADPARPSEFARWDDFRGDCGDIHTVEVDFIDERRIVAAATENGMVIDPVCSADRWSWGFVYILDATDLGDVRTLGKWHVPGVQPSEPFPRQDEVPPAQVGIFSAHNLHFVGGRVYEAMYHGGVWVLDVAPFVADGGASAEEILLRTDHVPTVGAYFPTCDTGGPNVWDVWVKDGYLYASDMDCGLQTLHFVGDALNDPLRTGDA